MKRLVTWALLAVAAFTFYDLARTLERAARLGEPDAR